MLGNYRAQNVARLKLSRIFSHHEICRYECCGAKYLYNKFRYQYREPLIIVNCFKKSCSNDFNSKHGEVGYAFVFTSRI